MRNLRKEQIERNSAMEVGAATAAGACAVTIVLALVALTRQLALPFLWVVQRLDIIPHLVVCCVLCVVVVVWLLVLVLVLVLVLLFLFLFLFLCSFCCYVVSFVVIFLVFLLFSCVPGGFLSGSAWWVLGSWCVYGVFCGVWCLWVVVLGVYVWCLCCFFVWSVKCQFLFIHSASSPQGNIVRVTRFSPRVSLD